MYSRILIFFNIPQWTDRLHDDYSTKVLLFMLVLPNVAAIFYMPVPYAAHTWSIGTEEQFYLLWPFIIRHTQRLLLGFLCIVFIVVAVRCGLLSGCVNAMNGAMHFANDDKLNSFNHVLINFFGRFRISCMAIGGIAAWLFAEKKTGHDESSF